MVREKDIIADTVPLFNAVKKQEENIEKPQNKKMSELILMALMDKFKSSLSPLENILEKGLAVKKQKAVMTILVTIINCKLLIKILRNSSWFFAP